MKRESSDKQKKQALNISIAEGSANSLSTGISNSYITPFALQLSNSDLNIGILSSISGLIAPLAQLYGSKLMDKYSRKKIVLTASLLQGIMWLPIIAVAIMKFYGLYVSSLIYLFIVFYSIFAALGVLYYPPWFSWMGDLVTEKEKGKYFGKRNTILGLVELLSVLIATVILKFGENTKYELIGFAIIFTISFLGRMASYVIIHNQYTTHAKSRKEYDVKLSSLIKENKNYRKFAIYQLFFNLAIMIASPFFAAYMLQKLDFNYWTYILVTISSSIFYLVFTPIVGKFSDRYGNVRLLVIANILFALNPLLWIFIKAPIMLIFIPQLVSGIANAASILSFTNFSYDYLTKEERGVGVAYANVLAGVGVFIGSLIGGIMLSYLNITFVNIFFFVFAVSAIIRIAVALIFLPGIKETKSVKRLPPMYVSLLHPFKSIQSEIGWVRYIFK